MLKDKFEKQWRPRDVTRWNRNNMQTFRQLLTGYFLIDTNVLQYVEAVSIIVSIFYDLQIFFIRLESSRGKNANQQHRKELENINTNYKVSEHSSYINALNYSCRELLS